MAGEFNIRDFTKNIYSFFRAGVNAEVLTSLCENSHKLLLSNGVEGIDEKVKELFQLNTQMVDDREQVILLLEAFEVLFEEVLKLWFSDEFDFLQFKMGNSYFSFKDFIYTEVQREYNQIATKRLGEIMGSEINSPSLLLETLYFCFGHRMRACEILTFQQGISKYLDDNCIEANEEIDHLCRIKSLLGKDIDFIEFSCNEYPWPEWLIIENQQELKKLKGLYPFIEAKIEKYVVQNDITGESKEVRNHNAAEVVIPSQGITKISTTATKLNSLKDLCKKAETYGLVACPPDSFCNIFDFSDNNAERRAIKVKRTTTLFVYFMDKLVENGLIQDPRWQSKVEKGAWILTIEGKTLISRYISKIRNDRENYGPPKNFEDIDRWF